MAVYAVDSTNWDDPSFWAAISESAGGHTLDFSGLGSNYTLIFDPWLGTVQLSDGTTAFLIGDATYGGASDASLGGTTVLSHFTTILGTQGDDVIRADSTTEQIYGVEGNDVFVLSDGLIQTGIVGGDGIDVIDVSSSTSAVTVTYSADGAGNVTDGTNSFGFSGIEGHQLTDGNDVVDASADSLGVMLDGGAGDDTLTGGSGDDIFVVSDGFGADTVDGGAGQDAVDMSALTAGVTVDYYGDGWGLTTVASSTDTISFSDTESWTLTEQADLFTAGADTLGVTAYGMGGDDTIWGGLGGDTLDGGDGVDTIYGDTGDDVIFGGAGEDDLGGDGGNDTIYGGAGDDYLEGALGDDTLDGGIGNDTLVGGEGQDTFAFQDGFGSDTVTGGETGTDMDLLDFSGLSTAVNMVFSASEAGSATDGTDTVSFTQVEGGVLTAQDDIADASSATSSVWIDGGAGNDSLDGGSGDDTLLGGAGADIIAGGAGSDTITAGSGDDIVIVSDDAGVDAIDLGEEGGDDDRLAFINTLGTGAATVTFTADGAATYSFGSGTGTASGIETVQGSTHDDVIDASSDSTGVSLRGGAGNDALTGGSGDDVLVGGSGVDTLTGGAGNDTFVIDDSSGDDVILGGAGNDTLDFSALGEGVFVSFSGDGAGTATFGTTTIDFSGIETVALTDYDDLLDASSDSAGVTVFGGAGVDQITGGSGQDVLFGGAGDDVLTGGAGNDTFAGEAGADTIVLTQGGGADTVLGFENTDPEADGSYIDQIDVLGLQDLSGGSVSASEVSTLEDAGSAMVLLPEGESLTFDGINEADLNTYASYTSLGIPCFTPGTMIRTLHGEVPIERLRPGDMVLTRDNGPQPVLWAAARRLDQAMLTAHENLRPVLIKAGAFGQEKQLIVSPQHGMLLGVEGEETLVRATHLARLSGGGARVMNGARKVTYIHLFFETHQVIWGNGLPSESFYPGPVALSGLEQGARAQLFELAPDLIRVADLAGTEDAYSGPARAYSRIGHLPDHMDGLHAL